MKCILNKVKVANVSYFSYKNKLGKDVEGATISVVNPEGKDSRDMVVDFRLSLDFWDKNNLSNPKNSESYKDQVVDLVGDLDVIVFGRDKQLQFTVSDVKKPTA